MDEWTDEMLENSTQIIYETDLQFEIHSYMRTFVCIVSLLSDLLIVAIILKSKKMRTRTNNVILHFAIADMFCMLNEMGLIYYIYDHVVYKIVPSRPYCMFAIYEVTAGFASLLFMIFLLSNTLIKTKRLSDKTLLIGYYVMIGALFIMHTLFCVLYHTYFPIFHMIFFFMLIVTFICLFVKEINRCCKICKKRPLSEKTTLRMNIARIYVYSWLISLFTYRPNNVIFLITSLFGYFSGFNILVLLVCSNRNFKICLLNLLRFRTQNYDIDATIGFEDDCSESSDDDRPAVNITFNGIETTQPETNNVT
ncbi:PREDICTED: uncharacterized protein LOC108569941 [Nicrophorus vespilloides]|uniref:Uncharacterized protein LOC108569941 n=1 Tax=Nicrophorus vespilloides TaxID=110193 RepID=A0ABM1NK60_NICVS|nr:PREDICTED: uncharacterized protein LOC108569941 [Nicrophorus vespilloides]